MPKAFIQPVSFWNDLQPLTFRNHWEDEGSALLHNNGKTVYLRVHRQTPTVQGGPLIGTYLLHQLHFHWGVDDQSGAHHVINHKGCAMEIHCAYYNARYDWCCAASGQPDGWVMVAIQLIVGKKNPAFTSLAHAVTRISQPGATTTLPKNLLTWLRREKMDRVYLTYRSETRPGELITWVVYEKPLSVSKSQIEVFRSLVGRDGRRITESACASSVDPLHKEIIFVRDTRFRRFSDAGKNNKLNKS